MSRMIENIPKQAANLNHVPVPALEPVPALAEFIGMLKNRTVAEVVHDRSFDRCCPIGEDRTRT